MAQAVLSALGSPDAELSILVVDDPEIARLNLQYLGRVGPTNVIAFPMREGDHGDISPQLLGDVVISVDTARREAESSGISTWERFTHLLVHGVLHLFGWDHETSEAAGERMEEKTNELLKTLGMGPDRVFF